jgi:hypothetical protein
MRILGWRRGEYLVGNYNSVKENNRFRQGITGGLHLIKGQVKVGRKQIRFKTQRMNMNFDFGLLSIS